MSKLGKIAVAVAMAFSVGAAFGYTSASYVQDGLIAQWDGIDNAVSGARRIHKGDATTWADLSGGGHDMSGFSGSFGFADDALVKTAVGAITQGFGLNPQTYEVVIDLSGCTVGQWIVPLSTSGKFYPTISLQSKTTYQVFYGSKLYGFKDAALPENGTVTLACSTDGSLYVDGEKMPQNNSNYWGSNGDNVLGGSSAGHSNNNNIGYKIHSIRFYDRVLTADEVYQNAAIDDARFFGRGRPGVLSVRSSPEECAEATADASFLRGLKPGDAVTLPVSAEWMNAAQTVHGVCTGYQILVNGEVREAHTFAEGESRVATYPSVADDDIVELVWLWDAEYRAFAVAKGGGMVDVETDWFAPGGSSAFTMTAAQDPSDEHIVEFMQWEDEAGVVLGTSPTITGVATGPRLYTARFVTAVCVATDGDDANSGANWDHPLATLSRALEVAHNGEMIVFDDGVYSNLDITATTTIDRPLTITSRNGRDKTTLYFTFGANVRALTLADKDAVLRGVTLASNRSTSFGKGALDITAGRFTDGAIIGFSCQRAESYGVAANLSGGTICNTVISNNYTYTTAGSAPYGTLVLAGGKAVADRCTIVDNEVASSTGSADKQGAVYVAGGTTLRNSLVARNKKPNKNSGVNIAANGVVDNCTIIGNICGSATDCGGVYAASGAIIRNTIIAGNTNSAGERNFTLLDPGAKLSNCCSPDDISGYGEGNKVVAPEFVDAANGDYHLAAGPCINGGAPLDWMDDSSLDLDGRPRTIGEKPDIGCYEKVAGKLTVSVVPSATFGLGELSVDFTASVDGADLEGLSYKWYLSGKADPDFDGPDAEVHWDYLEPGSYTVRIEASNAAGEKAEAVYEDLITVAPSVVYVSKTSTPRKPYATWETAANTIEDAMTAAGEGVTVMVGDGEYPVSGVIMLDKDITLVSTNGPDKTTLLPGKAGNFQLVNLSDSRALLSGFTLRDSVSQAVGMLGGGTVSNCVFRNNTSDASTADNGGSGAFVSGAGNVITHCVFSNNTISVAGTSVRHGAAVYVADNAFCAIDNCLFVRNVLGVGTATKYGTAVRFGSKSTGRVRNCMFLENSGTGSDTRGALALVESGTIDVENCTFVGNGTSSENCAGLYADGNAHVVNCLFADNTNASGVSNVWLGASATLTTCRDADDYKDFKRAEDGDYRLASGSPCVDGGTELDWMYEGTDLMGSPRIRLETVDVGCYELQQLELELAVEADVTTGFEPLAVTFTAKASGPALDGIVYSWSFKDGGETYDIVKAEGAATITNVYDYGRYRVHVKAELPSGETAERDLTDEIVAVIGKAYIDPTDPTAPSLADVLSNEFLGDGAVITIRNGTTNEVSSAITVDKPVQIVAEPGTGETFIRPQVAGDFRMLTLSDPGATLCGFTVCGSTYQAVALVGGGTVSNCVFRGNSGSNNTAAGKGGSAVYVSGAGNLVTHCVITNNYISFGGGSIRMGAGVFVDHGAQCDIDNCVFRDNRIGTGANAEKYGIAVCHEGSGRIRNCLFAENGSNPPRNSYDSHTHGALAVYNGKSSSVVDIENCTIVENRVGGENCAGLYTTGATTVNVLNCLIAHNAGLTSVSNCELSANTTLTSCRITDGLADFKRPARGDYHLKVSSPAKDAGTFADWMAMATDLDGNPRVRQGEVDIGCYEGLKTGFMILVGGEGTSSSGKKPEPVIEEPKSLPVLRIGIVSDVHINSDSDPNDSKTWGVSSNHLFEKAITKFRDRGVDAIVVPGDMTENGGLNELEKTELAWKRVFPDGDVDADGNAVAKLFIRGNHDDMAGTNGQGEEELVRHDPSKAWKDVFGIDWYDHIMLRNVKGYVFILVDWNVASTELDAFFVEHGADLPKDRPFFYVQHSAPPGTIGGDPDATLGGCSKYLKNYPNCIALSGHSHNSITLGDQTWQGDFLSLGCGCLQYIWNRAGRDNSWNLASGQVGHTVRCSSGGHQGMFLTVEEDRVVVERFDIANDEKVGPDHVFPRDGTKPYSFEAQRARAVAPQFPQGATAVVSERAFHSRSSDEKWTDEDQVIVTVPRAARCDTDEGRVYEYECTVYTDEGESNPLIVRKVLAANWFLNDARVESETLIAFGKDELPTGVTLRFAIRPMDDWGNRGNPIFTAYTVTSD